VKPGDPDSIARGIAGDVAPAAFDPAHDLVTRHDPQTARLEISLDHVQIRSTHAANFDTNEQLAGIRHERFALAKLKRPGLDGGRGCQHH